METRELLKDFRKSKHMNQTDFADKLGVPQTTYSCYESGRNPIPDSFIKLVSAVYGISEEWLRTGEGEKEKKLTDDEELVEFFGAFLADGNPERKRVARSILNLIDAIPEKYYPSIAAFVQEVIDKQNEE